jgi:glucose/arabinose dehydrogenase
MILRINSDGSIPTDNPFYTTATSANRAIWALGLRNPFTFAIDRLSGTMFVNDVSENTWE